MTYTPYTPLYAPFSYPAYSYAPAQQNIQNTQNTQSQGMIWVRNAQEAAMYPVAPNNAVSLWDSGAPVIYLKQADASGKPTMKTYDLVERVEKIPEKEDAFATKTELAALAGVVKNVDGVLTDLRKDLDALKEPKKEETDNG